MHYGAKVPWGKLLQDYNILEGRLWVLVLFAVFMAPFVIFRIRS